MSGVLNIEVSETADELQALMKQQQRASQRSKVQVLWWLKTGQASGIKQLAQMSGYHRTTVSRWLSQYRQSGLAALVTIAPRSGRPRAISGDVLSQLKSELQEPEGFTSYKEVQQWLAAVHGQRVPYKTVHKTVRYGLKAKLKVPRPVSQKQSPGAAESFKQTLDTRCLRR